MRECGRRASISDLETAMEKEELKSIILDAPGKLLHNLKDRAQANRIIRQLWEIAASKEESKEIKKAVKKALYALRSSGVNVDIQKPQKEIQKKRDYPDEIDQAMLSLPDSKDKFMLIISTPNRKTLSLDIHQILLDSRDGILDYRVEGMSRRSFEKLKTESEDFVPVPTPYALGRLHRVMKRSPENKLKRIPEILKEKKQEVEHPILGLLGTTVSRILTPSEEMKIFSERALQRITLSASEVEPFMEQIEEAKASRLIIDNMSPEQRVEDIIERFCRVYFTEERRDMYREYLFDIALYYYYNEKEHYAKILVEYGKKLMTMRDDIMAHPFVQFLIYKDIIRRGE
jgi:hypothetical protein